ncbi:MAG: S8 family serine peptidase, partial [Pseudomonadota bacterium]
MTDPILDALRPQPTGGLIVTFKQDADLPTQLAAMENSVGAGVRSFSAQAEGVAEFDDATPALVLEDVGIAFVSDQGAASDAEARLTDNDSTEEVRPEFWMFDTAPPFDDTADRTWGVAATGADTSNQNGAGIKVCVLDTGLDLHHADFAARSVTSRSFVPNEAVQDGQGHGTHCAGTACGRNVTPNIPRYGVAPEAELFVGKVLNNAGSGRERDILAGMLWAIQEGCDVISMSLGRAVRPGETHSLEYERLGRMALDRD